MGEVNLGLLWGSMMGRDGDLDFGLGFVGEFRFVGKWGTRWEKSGDLLGG